LSGPSLERPRALITGASSGIGVVYAERLARQGYDLVLVARRRERLAELAERLKRGNGITADVVCADLTDAADLARVETLAGSDEALRLLINNAGFAGYQPFVSIDPEVIDDLVDIHVRTVARLSRAVLPGMVRRRKGKLDTLYYFVDDFRMTLTQLAVYLDITVVAFRSVANECVGPQQAAEPVAINAGGGHCLVLIDDQAGQCSFFLQEIAKAAKQFVVAEVIAARRDDGASTFEKRGIDDTWIGVLRPDPHFRAIYDALLLQLIRDAIIDVVADVLFVSENLVDGCPGPWSAKIRQDPSSFRRSAIWFSD
jgi:hypothetical protein